MLSYNRAKRSHIPFLEDHSLTKPHRVMLWNNYVMGRNPFLIYHITLKHKDSYLVTIERWDAYTLGILCSKVPKWYITYSIYDGFHITLKGVMHLTKWSNENYFDCITMSKSSILYCRWRTPYNNNYIMNYCYEYIEVLLSTCYMYSIAALASISSL